MSYLFASLSRAPRRPRSTPDAVLVFLGCGGILTAAVLVDLAALPGRTICLFRNLFSIPCAGCGMTRAFLLLGHGRWADAVRMNLLSPLAFATLVALFLDASSSLFGLELGVKLKPSGAKRLILAAFLLTAASWVYNMALNPAFVLEMGSNTEGSVRAGRTVLRAETGIAPHPSSRENLEVKRE